VADAFLGLTELVKVNNQNVNDLGVSDLFDDAPLLKALHAVPASNGTTHSYLKETTAPVVGFRAVNTGVENVKSADTQVDVTLKLVDASFSVDVAIARAYRKGPEAFIAREAKRFLRQAFFVCEKQYINGTVGGSASGFTGMANATNLDGLSDTGNVVDAGGTTAATGSSIWLIRTNPDEMDVCAVAGNDGEINIEETYMTTVTETSGVGRFDAYRTPILAYLGLQIGSAISVVRIANCTADSGKGATDLLISRGLALFPASRQPTIIAMGRRSRQQLQASRTATNATGAPAPIPMDSFGIPIICTDGITATETLLA
jgi:hypothetical protein